MLGGAWTGDRPNAQEAWAAYSILNGLSGETLLDRFFAADTPALIRMASLLRVKTEDSVFQYYQDTLLAVHEEIIRPLSVSRVAYTGEGGGLAPKATPPIFANLLLAKMVTPTELKTLTLGEVLDLNELIAVRAVTEAETARAAKRK